MRRPAHGRRAPQAQTGGKWGKELVIIVRQQTAGRVGEIVSVEELFGLIDDFSFIKKYSSMVLVGYCWCVTPRMQQV